jgi:hypothetical protein
MDDEPTPNLALLRKTFEQIKIPKVWDQSTWMYTTERSECGTAGCFAGWAVSLTGRYELLFMEVAGCKAMFVDMVEDLDTGERDYLATVAERELGLTEDEAEWLFDGRNSMGTIRQLCESIAERAGEKF